MSGILAAIFFGWPSMLAALTLASIGLIARRARWLAAGSALFLLPAWELSGYPAIRGAAFLLPLLLFVASLTMQKGKILIAWLLSLLVVAATAGLAMLVRFQGG